MLVGVLLSALALGVLQLALALHVRMTLLDAASEGAHYAALGGSSLAEGVRRTEELIGVALGPGYPVEVTASDGVYLAHPAVVVTVTAPLPLAGLFGPPMSLEVSGHAAVEPADR